MLYYNTFAEKVFICSIGKKVLYLLRSELFLVFLDVVFEGVLTSNEGFSNIILLHFSDV